MIRYWVYRAASESEDMARAEFGGARDREARPPGASRGLDQSHRIRIGRREVYMLIACMLALAALGWWQWQRSWSELEKRAWVRESRLRVSPETMEKRIVTKVEPVYPEAARTAGTEGLVVLDAVIAPDGSVKTLRPVSGTELLVRSATQAVQSWKFEPYLSSGNPVEVETTITVEFRLN